MAKALVAYASVTGNTERMAQYIAEGVRISGCEATIKNVSAVKNSNELDGFDGYIFGCPTYHRDMTENMKVFLFLAKKAGLEGKLAGAFGSYTHSTEGASLVLETMEFVFNMERFELGAFNLQEDRIDGAEGRKACQDYGKTFGERIK